MAICGPNKMEDAAWQATGRVQMDDHPIYFLFANEYSYGVVI